MNILIKNQLKNVKIANLGKYDDDSTTIIIPKKTDKYLEENKYYLIKLNTPLEDPLYQQYTYFKIDVNKIQNGKVKVLALAYDFKNNNDVNIYWEG